MANGSALAFHRRTWQSMRLHTMSSVDSKHQSTVDDRAPKPTADVERLSAVLRAAAHPIRVSVLRVLAQRTMSPVELSRSLGRPEWSLGVIAYHVRLLASHGIIELVQTIQRRGAVEHRYAVTPAGRALAAAVESLAVPADARQRRRRPRRTVRS
jgi:DNA-binding HxlR family transcriptional regulator